MDLELPFCRLGLQWLMVSVNIDLFGTIFLTYQIPWVLRFW
jgi:hypothetical protein